MALAKRIIPCLDVAAGRVVKGVRFVDLADAGDPVAVARRYDRQGADEIAFLDITASAEARDTMVAVVEKVAREVFIPLTVGGGIRRLQDIRKLLNVGADKVSINTTAIERPDFIREASAHFGNQCIVVALDAKRVANQANQANTTSPQWQIYTHGGRNATGLDALDWARRMVGCGAGELLVTSMDRDGTREGFDLELIARISAAVSVPVIASGGVGNLQHLADGIRVGGADAVLAASIFHFGEHTVQQAKQFMAAQEIEVSL